MVIHSFIYILNEGLGSTGTGSAVKETSALFLTKLTRKTQKGAAEEELEDGTSLPSTTGSKCSQHSEEARVLSRAPSSVFKIFIAFIGVVVVSKTM